MLFKGEEQNEQNELLPDSQEKNETRERFSKEKESIELQREKLIKKIEQIQNEIELLERQEETNHNLIKLKNERM